MNADLCTLNVNGAGSLVTTPPAVEGVLTSCGETRLTCSNDNAGAENTRWTITAIDSSPVCRVTIDHTAPQGTPYSCNEFSFEDITAFTGAVSALNSTAVVNPLPLGVSGSQVDCIAGARSTSPLVGNITLCVIGEYIYCKVWFDLNRISRHNWRMGKHPWWAFFCETGVVQMPRNFSYR